MDKSRIQAEFKKKTQCSVKYVKLVDLNSQHEFNKYASQNLKGKGELEESKISLRWKM